MKETEKDELLKIIENYWKLLYAISNAIYMA